MLVMGIEEQELKAYLQQSNPGSSTFNKQFSTKEILNLSIKHRKDFSLEVASRVQNVMARKRFGNFVSGALHNTRPYTFCYSLTTIKVKYNLCDFMLMT